MKIIGFILAVPLVATVLILGALITVLMATGEQMCVILDAIRDWKERP